MMGKGMKSDSRCMYTLEVSDPIIKYQVFAPWKSDISFGVESSDAVRFLLGKGSQEED